MTPKLAWSEKLRRHRKDKAENYARAILEPPIRVPLYSALRFPGVVLIMGDIRAGKTALAHEIARLMNERRNLPAILHLPKVPDTIRRNIQKELPQWITVVSNRAEWVKDSVVIFDEAAQSAHARRNQSGDAIEIDDLLAISGQRRQLILFISHHSRKLDVNVCTAVHRIIWKRPTYAHQIWEREEMSDFTSKAFEFFKGIKDEVAQKKASLVLDFDNFRFLQTTNGLPPWWSDNLSCLFQDVQKVKKEVMRDYLKG
ncbi:MAG TPA: ATP-binding protein [Dehalococcoidia bacterium]|nr:ATP-binding protein [Dehalococcoidia bacterium]